MSNRLTKLQLLSALTEIHERTIESPLLGGAVLIREPTVRIMNAAIDAARVDDDQRDDAVYHAMIIHYAIVDPESGVVDPRTGRIDPRSRTPLLTVEEALDIAEGRPLPTRYLVEEIMDLAAHLPRHLKSGDPAADGGERSAGSGAEVRQAGSEGSPDGGTGDVDQQSDVAAQPVG